MFTGFFTSSERKSSKVFGVIRHSRAGSFRAIVAALAIALAGSVFVAQTADARLGGGGSFGSRGSRSYSMPSATSTAPRVSPFQNATPSGGSYGNPGFAGRSPGMFGGGGGLFGGGLGRGLIGGFLGAGLFGMLFGGGLTGGLGGGMSLIGLILQLGLLYLGFRFVMGFFANRRQTAAFGQTFGAAPLPGGAPPVGQGYQNGGYRTGAAPQSAPITIGPEDYQAFERRLAESQAAYSSGDRGALQRIATPEMAGNFEQELADNDRQGVVNKISDVRLLQGDLSEAWRESGSDYATVAMRFSLIDTTVEKASGRIVAGNAMAPQEVTEVWTFRRPAGGGAQAWALSGIQQA